MAEVLYICISIIMCVQDVCFCEAPLGVESVDQLMKSQLREEVATPKGAGPTGSSHYTQPHKTENIQHYIFRPNIVYFKVVLVYILSSGCI